MTASYHSNSKDTAGVMARTRPFKRRGPPSVSRDTATQSLKVSLARQNETTKPPTKKRKALGKLTNAAAARPSLEPKEDNPADSKPVSLNSYQCTGKVDYIDDRDAHDPPKGENPVDSKPSTTVSLDSYQYTGKVDYIDERDAHDTLCATPYVEEMYIYHRQQERCARPGFLERSQPHMTPSMRSKVIDWILSVHFKFRLIPETLYLAVNMFDRYLEGEGNVVSTGSELKLLGATALLIASKYEEVFYLDLYDLVAECGGACTREEILKMEETLLKALEHRITVPTAYTFILRALKAAHANKRMIQYALYLLDGSLQCYDLVTRYLPSQLAAATVFIARNHIGRNAWSPTLLKYANYCQEDIEPVARAILTHHEAASHELVAVNQKYGCTRYGEVADTVFICDF